MPTTAYVPHSLLVLPENKLVTVADSRWYRLGWAGPQGTGEDSRGNKEKGEASALTK